jgi:hypothetical protein
MVDHRKRRSAIFQLSSIDDENKNGAAWGKRKQKT